MSDVFVTVLLATISAWIACAILGLLCQRSAGVRFVRLLFGSARGALFLPVAAFLTVVVILTTLHRATNLVNVSNNLSGDDDGCIHWMDHLATVGVGAAPMFVAGLLVVLAGGVVSGAVRDARNRRRLVKRIDRSATRALRRVVGASRDEGFVYVTSTIEDSGAFATALGGRRVVMVPLSSTLDCSEVRAVVLHERAHHARGHLRRRFWFEYALGMCLPAVLLRPVLRHAREEEEWEADRDAARILGSRSLVARAVLNAAERTSFAARCQRECAYVAERWGLDTRVRRLIFDTAPVPYLVGRPIGLCALLGALKFVALWSCPEWGIWLFCQTEQILGISCTT